MNSGGPWLPGEKAALEAAQGAAGIESGLARCGPHTGWVQIHHGPLSVSIPSQPLSPWVLFDVACALSQGFSCWAGSNFWLVSGASGKQRGGQRPGC